MAQDKVKQMMAVNAAIEIMKEALHTISTYGINGMPSGHLYAIMSNIMSLEQYEKMIDLMIQNKLLTKRGDLLIANKL